MRTGTPSIASLGRALDLLQALVRDQGQTNVSRLAASEGVPVATAHRIARTLASRGFLSPAARGRFVAGPALLALAEALRPAQALAALARRDLHELARETRRTAHLGVLENEMVTYLVKAGDGRDGLFTQEGMQLEAYCSGIGKVLLAHLPEEELDAYLAGGPFVALTEMTRTDPKELREELAHVRDTGFATDEEEVAPGLACLAVPIHWPDGRARAAISVSTLEGGGSEFERARLVSRIRETAASIERRMFSPAPAVPAG